MALLEHIRAFVVISLLAANAVGAKTGDPPAVEWLRGSGRDLQICLRGEVVDADGQPATGVKLAGSMNGSVTNIPLTPSVEGHRFKVWVSVNQSPWYSMWLKATSANNDHVAYKTFGAYELRQAAIDRIKLTLQAPTRHVDVKVTDKGQPVAGAKVKAEIGFRAELQSTTNANGIARLELLPRQELQRLTAWTDDHRIGGYSFDRSPPRDPNVDVHVVELSKCRDQKVRFVDERGTPVPGVKFAIQVATAPPNYNFIGSNDHSRMTTDAAGEAYLKERNWPLPKEGHVAAVAFDDQGKELGRLDTDVGRAESAGEVADFIHHHAPPTGDAEAKWNAAFAEAKQSNRRVWVRLCQRDFSPCFRLARWLDEQRELLGKDYVMLKIDNVRDENAARVVERITHGEPYGVYAIFDPSGKMLIDSKGPLDNISYPGGIEGKKHLRKMLLATRQNLSDAEIDQLVESVGIDPID